MTPTIPQLALILFAFVQVSCSILMSQRVSWRKHPALITQLLSESLWSLVAVFHLPIAFDWSTPLQAGIRTAVAREVLTFARLSVPRQVVGAVIVLGAAATAFCAGAPGLHSLQRELYLLRSYYHLGLFAVLAGASVWRAWVPVLECRRHLVYRLGATAQAGVIALAGSFVPGGLGYRLLPRTVANWQIVSILTCAALMLVVAVMAHQMSQGARTKAEVRVGDVWVGLRRAA